MVDERGLRVSATSVVPPSGRHTWWVTALTATLAVFYGWIGLAGHGLDRVLGLAGAALILVALPVARRSRSAAAGLLVLGAGPLAVAAWWSIAAPLVGLLALPLGWLAIRAQARITSTRT